VTYTIKTAIQCEFFDEIIISSDDLKVFKIYTGQFDNDERVKFIFRPKELADDNSMAWEVVEHACGGYDSNTIIVYLQPTSPLRTPKDIDNSLKLFMICKQFGLISVSWEYPDHEMRINGAIYIQYLSSIINLRSFVFSGMLVYIMPKNRSIDIDTVDDFVLAEMEMDKN
jgi:CMP-N-acetylneuraminic acid synthetase